MARSSDTVVHVHPANLPRQTPLPATLPEPSQSISAAIISPTHCLALGLIALIAGFTPRTIYGGAFRVHPEQRPAESNNAPVQDAATTSFVAPGIADIGNSRDPVVQVPE
ncbi:hypothetical protein FS837_005310, partial [Tulasnella sp. UAMH 9824]